ncbi:MAG: hypothetical protein KIT02_05610 [Devosia sp.]|uniref:hypothetical protein n=1 Tax=Devosia sp. TaxID=1871048 RepID=UPI0024C8AA2E|nr:hypothetical protein [Devosia sp.]UYO00690.1 MAG: hypothetical protein KIT02_05610 [Devosia sp.]
MIVNKSMFPLQTGFSVISNMQDKFAQLQMQLGTGMKAQTLSELGRDLPVSLSVRSRLNTIAGYTSNIDQVSLRLSFYDNFLTRMDKVEGEARNSAVQGQYGSGNINMATIPGLSKARFDEMVTMLNGDIAGRYLFGGSVTDKAPLPTSTELLNGAGGRAGYQTVVTERKAADAGTSGQGRIQTSIDPLAPETVSIAEDGVHPFGFKLSTLASTSGAVTVTQPSAGTAPLGDEASVSFAAAPNQIAAGQTVTLGFTLPDGTETQIVLTAIDAADAPASSGQFVVGADADETATNFQTALNGRLVEVGKSELAAASTFAASQNFFNAAGEPVLRVSGDPATATSLRIATATDTVMWYSGQTASVSATGLGRTTIGGTGDVVTLSENVPVSASHGFQISGAATTVSGSGTSAQATYTGGDPANMSVQFDGTEAAGDSITLTLTEPGGRVREVTLTAVTGKAGPGQFTIGADADATAANFSKALERSMTEASTAAEGNPRQSVTSAVEDSGRINYGMQANESGYLRMIRTFAAMTVESYPEVTSASDPNSVDLNPAKQRFDAMARRQQLQLSETHNVERGSIEVVTMELGVARAALEAATDRHTSYKAQLDNLLSDVETVSKEDVAMEILALQTRLTASYQVTSMVSQLSLVNFLR